MSCCGSVMSWRVIDIIPLLSTTPLFTIYIHYCLFYFFTLTILVVDQASQFHFRNGAELYKINWQANVESEGSVKSSLGIMVNYLYQLDRLEQNARNYALDSRQYVLSDEVRQCMLLR